MESLLKQYINDYLDDNLSERWIVVPGLRGVGKTTLIGQVYKWAYQNKIVNKPKSQKIDTIYLSLDVIISSMDSNLNETLKVYEAQLKNRFENNSNPVLIFIDEVQKDPNWAKILKIIYDRTSNVFIVCTGSSATYLQMDADTASRRAVIERLLPLSFIEYQKIVNNKLPTKGISKSLQKICYQSDSAVSVYNSLKKYKVDFNQAWQNMTLIKLSNIYKLEQSRLVAKKVEQLSKELF